MEPASVVVLEEEIEALAIQIEEKKEHLAKSMEVRWKILRIVYKTLFI